MPIIHNEIRDILLKIPFKIEFICMIFTHLLSDFNGPNIKCVVGSDDDNNACNYKHI